MYTHAFAELLIRKCATAPGFLEVVGRPPHEKAPDEAGAVREEP